MNSTRIGIDDTSRVSTFIGVGVALVLISVVAYLTLVGHARAKETTGFDPNRPVPSDAE